VYSTLASDTACGFLEQRRALNCQTETGFSAVEHGVLEPIHMFIARTAVTANLLAIVDLPSIVTRSRTSLTLPRSLRSPQHRHSHIPEPTQRGFRRRQPHTLVVQWVMCSYQHYKVTGTLPALHAQHWWFSGKISRCHSRSTISDDSASPGFDSRPMHRAALASDFF
jgi:hypothetical protein